MAHVSLSIMRGEKMNEAWVWVWRFFLLLFVMSISGQIRNLAEEMRK